jgi:hypothetical protein
MNIEEMKKEIIGHEEGRKQSFVACNEFYVKLQEACISFMKNEIKDIIEREVKNNPEITKELGLETLKIIKQKMNDSILHMETLVPELFVKQYLNKHEIMKVEEGNILGQKYNIQQEIKNDINSVVRNLLSPVGEIFIEYKYEKAGSGAWKKDYSTNNKIQYRYSIDVSNEVGVVMKEYSTKCQEMFEHICQIDKLNKQISKLEAEDLWSRA